MTISPLAASSSFRHPNPVISPSFSSIPNKHRHCVTVSANSSILLSLRGVVTARKLRRERRISCEVALKPDSATVDAPASSSSSSSSSPISSAAAAVAEDDELSQARIGARVRVKVPLKVYHVPKVPEVDITGMEGELKQYIGLWKGKRISANLPFKVVFATEIKGRGPVKFFTHLKDEEFDYVD